MKTAILFAGQGAQHVSMGKDFYAEYPGFRRVFDLLPEEQRRIAEAVLKMDLQTYAVQIIQRMVAMAEAGIPLVSEE